MKKKVLVTRKLLKENEEKLKELFDAELLRSGRFGQGVNLPLPLLKTVLKKLQYLEV